jgi:hypothetical protein
MTVTLYVPALTVGSDEPLPHPVSVAPNDSRRLIPRTVNIPPRLRRLKKAQNSAAKLTAEAGDSHGFLERFNSARVPVVTTTRVAVELPPAVSVTLAGLIEQEPLVGMPEQENVTAPLNVAFAARFSVAVPVAPAVMDSAAGVPESVNAGASAPTVIVEVAEVAGLKFVSPE